MNATLDLKKQIRAIDLSVAAARKRQSPRTGFLHWFPGDESASDTIPVYENFCFVFALFRLKTSEAILEGKQLLERLFAFQTDSGNFPVYLHDYPRCWDLLLPLKIAPFLVHILHKFGSIIGTDLKEKIEKALKSMRVDSEKKLSPLWEQRWRVLQNEPLQPIDTASFTAQEWFEWIVTEQLANPDKAEFPAPYHPDLQVFLGPHQSQEKGEPRPVSIEYVLAEELYPPRLLKEHIQQLYAAALLPFKSSWVPSNDETSEGILLWKGEEKLHSLTAPKGTRTADGWIFHLPDGVEIGRELVFETALFCDVSSETELFIEGKKGSVFRLGETVSIHTPLKNIDLRFELVEGEGTFCGHLLRGNRPNQISQAAVKDYEAFDWVIGLRSLRRSSPCTISVSLRC